MVEGLFWLKVEGCLVEGCLATLREQPVNLPYGNAKGEQPVNLPYGNAKGEQPVNLPYGNAKGEQPVNLQPSTC
ncbi:hypothetical protein [Moorena sp. SIO4A5]|uniref:hypothetical protein n=1 Tax=Moorena sp. SIO4A5 TaxID=2607838 RepID=UPI0013CC8F0D|nr:hypothetical protein [Moorena sp. SIO4A5]NEO22429.1 hypothetical protein [Moorena sp. SIO4A5]